MIVAQICLIYLFALLDYTDSDENLNIALDRPAFQSSVMNDHGAGKAVDGNTENDQGSCQCCTHTLQNGFSNPWWAVDLEGRHTVTSVTLTNRVTGGTAYQRLRNIHIGLSDDSPVDVAPALTNYAECFYQEAAMGNGATETFQCHNDRVVGRYLIVQVEHTEALTICEAQVFEDRTRMKYKAEAERKLPGHTLGSPVTVVSALHCISHCMQNSDCSSINYNKDQNLCEMNDATYDEELTDASSEVGWKWYNRHV